ncbi:hypothetical protein GSI_04054 [Ganoderma sinense ZZ0214-1]|uniref:Fungal-type protein kinase domain-containing protein n=1 Tax=Ganoderma sinense ZZ0214-1 TaxID=1077348 RepID=A0A2G8SI46_9APHY|nr:hypothetical protein GSI_04054 [Ganoderma sinense ZZ0214-1]
MFGSPTIRSTTCNSHQRRKPTCQGKEYSTRLKIAFPDTEFTFLPFAPNDVEDNSARTLPRFRVDLPLMCESANQDPFDDNLPTGAPRDRQRRAAFDQVFAQVEHILHHQYRTFLFMVIFVGLSARLVRFDRSSVFVTRLFDITGSDVLIDFLGRYTHLFPEDRGYDTTARYIDPAARDPCSLAEKMRRCLQDAKARKDEDYIIEMWDVSLDERWPWWKLRYLKDTWRAVVTDPLDEASYIRKEGATLHDLNVAKTNNVPTLVCHGDLLGQHTRAPATWAERLPGFKPLSQTYQHYRLVVQEAGKPLSELENSGDLVTALYDCIEAHRGTMKVGIIHWNISLGSIILYNKTDRWHGLLTNWELAKDCSLAVRLEMAPGRIGNKRFALSFFHVMIYCAVCFLKHNIPDEFVGSFLHNYFHISSGCTQTGEFAASALKRNSMVSGTISLLGFGTGNYYLRFDWRSPLLLFPYVHNSFGSPGQIEFSSLAHLSPGYLKTLYGLSANLDHHSHVMQLIRLVGHKPFPLDKVDDKQPVCEFCLANSGTP